MSARLHLDADFATALGRALQGFTETTRATDIGWVDSQIEVNGTRVNVQWDDEAGYVVDQWIGS